MRLLNPRIVIYLILTLALAWLMHRQFEAIKRRSGQTNHQSAPAKEQFYIRANELGTPETATRPMLLLLAGTGDDLAGLQKQLQEKFARQYSVILLNCQGSADYQNFFNVAQLPCALLFDEHNDEIGRMQENIDFEQVSQWLDTYETKE